MSDQDDAVFLRNFGLVLLGLVVIAFIAFFLAQTVTSSAQSSDAAALAPLESVSRVS